MMYFVYLPKPPLSDHFFDQVKFTDILVRVDFDKHTLLDAPLDFI